jgi:hypothetical protein
MATNNTTFRNSQSDNAASKFNRMDIRTSGGASTLVTFTITWGSSSTGAVSVASTPVSSTASATGTAAEARLYHSTGGDEISGLTVATSGANVTIDNTSITSGQTVNLTSFTYTTPSATA